MRKLDELDCDDLKPYCRWEGPAITAGPNGPIMCEGRYCEEAYEAYKEAHADEGDDEGDDEE